MPVCVPCVVITLLIFCVTEVVPFLDLLPDLNFVRNKGIVDNTKEAFKIIADTVWGHLFQNHNAEVKKEHISTAKEKVKGKETLNIRKYKKPSSITAAVLSQGGSTESSSSISLLATTKRSNPILTESAENKLTRKPFQFDEAVESTFEISEYATLKQDYELDLKQSRKESDITNSKSSMEMPLPTYFQNYQKPTPIPLNIKYESNQDEILTLGRDKMNKRNKLKKLFQGLEMLIKTNEQNKKGN